MFGVVEPVSSLYCRCGLFLVLFNCCVLVIVYVLLFIDEYFLLLSVVLLSGVCCFLYRRLYVAGLELLHVCRCFVGEIASERVEPCSSKPSVPCLRSGAPTRSSCDVDACGDHGVCLCVFFCACRCMHVCRRGRGETEKAEEKRETRKRGRYMSKSAAV